MKLKINQRARELYIKNCPVSAAKCNTYEELDYKIQRCVDLGNCNFKNEDLLEVRYHNRKLIILHNELIDMYPYEPEYKVSEQLKEEYYNRHFKVVV